MVLLVPMNDQEFSAYIRSSIENYASEKVKSGNWKQENALNLAKEEFHRLLPDGIRTKDQYLLNIFDEKTENNVGILWVGTSPRGNFLGAFIWDFLIHEKFRRKGYATQALKELEKFLKAMEIKQVSLHVFGHNHEAIALYQKAGYKVTNMNMSRQID